MADEEREIIGWRKVINVAGPGFSDTIKIIAADRIELEATIVESEGLVYERYGTDEEAVEIRRDYVVARSWHPLYEPEGGSDEEFKSGLHSDMLDELDREEGRTHG